MGTRLCRMTERTRIHWAAAICWIAAGLPCGDVSGVTQVADLVDQVSVDSYRDYLQNDLYAHDGDDRCFGREHDLAQQRIRERFEGFGLTTSLHAFAHKRVTYYNVVGILPGAICPSEIYIVGAHYDSVSGSPGAYDNASGVAGVLEAARVLSHYAFEATIIFIAFDREEQWMIGSTAYVADHAQDDIRSMVNLDCISYQPAPPGHPDYAKARLYYTVRTDLVDDLAAAMKSYAGVTCATGESNRSDHSSFSSAGFAAAWIWASSGGPAHKPWDSVDNPDNVNYEYATLLTSGVVGCLAAQARLAPVWNSPDFNGDWTVDIEDLILLIEHRGQDDPSFDIAPPPLGDGTVDIQDVEGLMHYWGQDIPEPGLIARWKLDETEGTIAHDTAGGHHDATVAGVPLWQPAGGIIGGALQFSGVGNFATAETVRDPSAGPLSVFAWVKGGAPGQAIISQTPGTSWLMAEHATGALMTGLRSSGRFSTVLYSEAVITNGDWHRVGVAWDGSHRRLYVDDVLVAEDTDVGLGESSGDLNIGCGATMAPATFWEGLIDDVRIYNRAIKP